MEKVVSLAQRARRLVDAKLGRCPRCMRLSIAGSLIGWGVFAAEYFVWPNRILLSLSVVVAGSFTLLMTSHIVAHMARLAAALREHEAGNHRLAVPNLSRQRRLGRRQLLTTVGIGGFVFALAALLPTRLARAGTRLAERPTTEGILMALVRLLLKNRVSRDELFRIGAAAQVATRSGLPFEFVWEESRKLAGLDQDGLLPTTVVNGQFQGQLMIPEGNSVTMEKFVAAEGQEIVEFGFRNNCDVPLVVDGQAGEFYFSKTLGPGDSLRIADPAFLPIVLLVVRWAAGGVVVACVAERVVATIAARQPVPCRLIPGYTKCNECAGDCPPGTTCQGTSFSVCYGFWVEPDSCGCL